MHDHAGGLGRVGQKFIAGPGPRGSPRDLCSERIGLVAVAEEYETDESNVLRQAKLIAVAFKVRMHLFIRTGLS